MKIYTRKGDDGTTGLLFGGRVRKDSPLPVAYGTVDEAQAALGVARAEAEHGGELDTILVGLERDLWVLMAELATDEANASKLVAGATLVTAEMVTALEVLIDEMKTRFSLGNEFVVPGQNRTSALLDVARAVTRRAERASLRGRVDRIDEARVLDIPSLAKTLSVSKASVSTVARQLQEGGLIERLPSANRQHRYRVRPGGFTSVLSVQLSRMKLGIEAAEFGLAVLDEDRSDQRERLEDFKHFCEFSSQAYHDEMIGLWAQYRESQRRGS